MIKKNIYNLLLNLKGISFKNQFTQITNVMSDESVLNNYISFLKKNILLHAYKNVPFYSKRLKETNVINNDKEINHSTNKTTKSELEREIRYLLDRILIGWQFANYQFGTCTGTIFEDN